MEWVPQSSQEEMLNCYKDVAIQPAHSIPLEPAFEIGRELDLRLTDFMELKATDLP